MGDPGSGLGGADAGGMFVPDLSVGLRIHVVGVGGAGMSAIASTLAAMGHHVTGSDLRHSRAVDRLGANGIEVVVGHDAANLGSPPAVDIVAVSTAIPETNPEVVAARNAGIPVVSRAAVLAAIADQRRTVAVAGTHGKTTTSSMLVLALIEAGLAPSFIVGGDLNEIGSGSAWDTGELLVIEADESDGTFLVVGRSAALVTNLEPDHLEHHGSWENLQDAFVDFVASTPGAVVVCADDDGALAVAGTATERGLAPGGRIVTYGVATGADYRMEDLDSTRQGCTFGVIHRGERLGEVHLPVAGAHNASNALGALAVAMELGASFGAVASALARFAGVARRFEHRGTAGGVTFVDDYAHLPTEVAAAVGAARDGDWDRVVCVFQPHRYSRTAALAAEFAGAFGDADVIAITDVYSAGEAPRPGVSGKLVVDAVLDAHPRARVAYLPRLADVETWLAAELRPGDLCLTLGAGDLTLVPSRMLEVLGGPTATPREAV